MASVAFFVTVQTKTSYTPNEGLITVESYDAKLTAIQILS